VGCLLSQAWFLLRMRRMAIIAPEASPS
jgi:hypothetical protein